MYRDTAEVYDALYDWKDYGGESERLHTIISQRHAGASSLLDVACGTGRHLEQLRRWYAVEGLDAEPALLAMAAGRLPGVPLHEGDMRTFRLGRTFDVVSCLFSSIGYMATVHELRQAIATMARHVATHGLLIIEPWLAPGRFDPGHIGGPIVGERPGMKVVRMNDSRVDGHLSIMNFHYLVGRPGSVRHLVEEHRVGLYTEDEYRDALTAAGLEAEHDPDGLMGRGLWIARRV